MSWHHYWQQHYKSWRRRWRFHPGSRSFRALSWQLLLSYLGAMTTVMGLSTIAVYQFVAYSLYQELDHQLYTLANAATHSLLALKAHPLPLRQELPEQIDYDEDLDIPWQDLRENDQSVEWFDAQHHWLGSSGKPMLHISLRHPFQPQQYGGVRTLMIPVYTANSAHRPQALQGYVQVSALTKDIETELNRLLAGLGVGGVSAVILIGGTGWWLTRRSLQPMERSMQQLQQFTADASHELRNPLTAIKTAIEVMQSHPERIHPVDQPKLSAIASATHQMTHLVEDLLLLARTDANSSSLTSKLPIPLDELLEDLLEFFQPQAIAKQLCLQAIWSGEVLVLGDAAQLRRLFANLLDNALHYTPDSGTVRVTMQPGDAHVVVTIEDTGIGIASAHLSKVFDRFWQADQARSWREDGTGLGLAIAQAIAEAHNGKITVTSQVGVGSCFRVQLPIV
ncbi:sensor histidine kinase [Pantanalinema sp. GBBB05]|uniref:sensor histidine kinase n=1 Tax=Pantanalinema sp. GBBB05 TaxID=2604139 RepID=UPI001D1AE3BB|nr:HAMP domain-containing histidine kinase [Pantanalinema sp. GBBB05]